MKLGLEQLEVLALYGQVVSSGKAQRDVDTRVGKRLLICSSAQQILLQLEQEIVMSRVCGESVPKKKKSYGAVDSYHR